MSIIIDNYRPLKSSLPRPSRETLVSVTNRLWNHSCEHVHELRKGNLVDHFFGACLEVSSSNLMAIVKLSAPYLNECSSIFRNHVETCVDYFWVASLLKNQPDVGKMLVENFFRYSSWQFDQSASHYSVLSRDDVFLKGINTPFTDSYTKDIAISNSAGVTFVGSWRNEKSLFPSLDDTKWESRAESAAEFVELVQNLKKAPYLSNLKALSSYSHFDPAQISVYSNEYRDAIYDRHLNIALGFLLDMLLYSFKRKSCPPPESLTVIHNEFIYYSL